MTDYRPSDEDVRRGCQALNPTDSTIDPPLEGDVRAVLSAVLPAHDRALILALAREGDDILDTDQIEWLHVKADKFGGAA